MNISLSVGIPQAIILFCYVMVLVKNIKHHGEPQNTSYNGWASVIGTAIGMALLTWGGFF
ncbi:hypothetical protein [Romboutsia sp.]|uniref:hypothetical protein n=1 Tax=Romboutsia sp. TaxID=1965302 RepID=UPI002B98091C|nr:hypothetical protein [Romboutsia sp.]HSQ88005.1 hypothetical protein [Romboutsia sp.]